ncbi:MAG: ATP-binding protein [Acetivibrio ethanolgignens]
MKRSLLVKFVVCYLFMGISIFTILNTFGINRIQHSLVENKKDVIYEEAGIISSEYMNNYYMDQLSLGSLRIQLGTIDTFLNARIWIVQTDGTVILDTRDSSIVRNQVNINELNPDFLENTFSEDNSFPKIFSEKMLSVVYPVTTNYQIKGFIVLHTPLAAIASESIYYTDIINICFLIFMVLMLFVMAYLFYVTVVPLHSIAKAAKEYSDGNFDYPLEIGSHDEYRTLAGSVSYMAGEIKSLDDYQKKFVANISHDFRSPLTSIKGYAEAILDGTIPVEMQGKYLEIILFETERLTKLTTNLLELNRFENKGVLLDITTFDINHVIKKTAESFEGSCLKKNISIELVFLERETYVSADMGKIQQVLYNLLDNAIKFSHHDSEICVRTEEKGEKVLVSVKDYGIGIPKESQKKVWERFYKTDASRGKDKKGTGLGLSITREIISVHNENINLISTEGIGSEFIFSLPRVEPEEA